MAACAEARFELSLTWLLRIAAAMCFIGHGAFGILTKAAWVPYFAVAGIAEGSAWRLMPLVGTMDIALGILALVAPLQGVWVWMTGWAVWTAVIRPLSGEPVWETLERAGNYGVPLALLLLARGAGWPRAVTVLRWSTVLLLVGHGMLAWGAKPLLVSHWQAILPHADPLPLTRAAAAVDLLLAFLVAVEPTGSLGLTACVWKLASEVLFVAAGAPAWEFVERGGSYAAPLVMGLWLMRQRPSVSLAGTRPALALFVGLALLCLPVARAQDATAASRGVSRTWSKLGDEDLVRALREGGLWIVFRHCATDWGQQDRRDLDLSLRENQRNLSAGGEADARALNAAFRALGIPVSSVESSTMFRCRETASMAFNDVVTTRELVGSDGSALRRRLTQAPPGQGNGVCVTHQVTIMGADAAVVLHEVEEGNCVIYRPGATPERLAHLAVRDLERLAGLPARAGGIDYGGAAAMIAAAERFLGVLDDTSRAAALVPFDATRTAWAATPEPSRTGVVMRELSAAQREAAFDLIATLLAPAAVQTVRDTMAVERQIVYQRNGAQLGPLEFHVAIHGRPAATGSWAWRVEGHHVVLMGTVHDGRVVGVTPMFLGAFPARTPDGSRLLAEEQDTVRTLVLSLTADQKAMAMLGDELPMTVMTRNEPMARPLAPAGLPLSRLDAAQAEAVQRLLAIFTRRLVPAAAEAALERIRGASLDGMSLAVVAPAPGGPVYLRLQGPTTAFEFLNSLGDTTHVHTVWRDFEHDYGAQATSVAAAPRVAGGPVPQRLPTVAATIAQLDSDGDGVLTSAELQPQVRARLMQADADRDGRITAEELRAARRRAGLSAD
jgi:hypothetical protein